MAHITGHIRITAPIGQVFDTVADTRNEPSFNPAMTGVELPPRRRSGRARGSVPAWAGRRPAYHPVTQVRPPGRVMLDTSRPSPGSVAA